MKTRRRNTGPSKDVRDLVRERAGYRCEACGCRGDQMDIHHRRPRALGGSSDPATNRPSNLVLLDRQCHTWFEANRNEARYMGWLVPQGHDPEGVPVLVFPDRLVLLANAGHYLDITPELEIRPRETHGHHRRDPAVAADRVPPADHHGSVDVRARLVRGGEAVTRRIDLEDVS